MAPPPLSPLVTVFFLLLSSTARSQGNGLPLSSTYYNNSCPNFDQIVQQTTTEKQISFPTTAAGTLRLFFHDCFVEGCDASVLVSSTRSSGATERDAEINLSLPGDAFDVVTRAKTALEIGCPGVVSCADILAVATRNLVVMTGGPSYTVLLGRKDSRTSRASDVKLNIPTPTMSIGKMINIFKSKNFTVQEMVALSGAHTIGFSHCKEFSSILYNYKGTSQSDPAYYPEFAKGLRMACSNFSKEPGLSVFNDIITPGIFDNKYYSNLKNGLGLLSSDHALKSNQRTLKFVDLYSKNQTAFFEAFAKAMEKLSVYGVKTGDAGEIRRRVFGNKCYIKRRGQSEGKFEAKANEGIFLGYSSKSKTYRVYNKRLNKMMESCDAKVVEVQQPGRLLQQFQELSRTEMDEPVQEKEKLEADK